MKEFLFFLLIFSLNFTTQGQLLDVSSPISKRTESLAKYICEAIDHVLNTEISTQRVAIVKHETNFDADFINDISRCISSDHTLLIADISNSNFSLQSPTVYVMITDKFEYVRATNIFLILIPLKKFYRNDLNQDFMHTQSSRIIQIRQSLLWYRVSLLIGIK